MQDCDLVKGEKKWATKTSTIKVLSKTPVSMSQDYGCEKWGRAKLKKKGIVHAQLSRFLPHQIPPFHNSTSRNYQCGLKYKNDKKTDSKEGYAEVE